MAKTPDPYEQRPEQVFPTLSDDQIARVARYGRRRRVQRGDILFEQGAERVPFSVVLEGAIEIVRPNQGSEDPVIVHHAGQFTGETSLLTGRRSLVRARVVESGEVLDLDNDSFHTLMQIDSELGEIIMRAFILRRMTLISRGWGDVVLVGSQQSPATLGLREFLMRNAHPHRYRDVDIDPDADEYLAGLHAGRGDLPVLVCRDDVVLRKPTLEEVTDCLGWNAGIDVDVVRDLLVVGAGPAGLAAAVYGASEGLDVLVLESHAPGGQAGSSSRIENYLGFPTGISGQALAGRAFSQAEKFGASIAIARSAAKLVCDKRPFAVKLSNGQVVRARAVVIASGAQYRKPAIERLSDFEGTGVYYAATAVEEQLCHGDEVVIVGGGNSAGQAAAYLAEKARQVYVLCRGISLESSMSHYLIQRLQNHPRIKICVRTEIEALEGTKHLDRVRWRTADTGTVETHPVRHVFLMTGAVPNTVWIGSCLALDDKGFVKAGPDLTPDDLRKANWPLARAPYLLETSLPGIFVVGDARAGSVKRVASAVGEGSVCIQLVHKTLAE